MQQKTFKQLRFLMARINESICNGYIDESWKYYKDELVELYNGNYAKLDDCVHVEEYYYHSEIDSDMYVMDEITNDYILEENAILVSGYNNGQYEYCTHRYHLNDCSHDIYRYQRSYVDSSYMEYNSLVIDVNGDIDHLDNLYYWESDGEYHTFEEEEENTLIQSYSYRPITSFKYLSSELKNNTEIPFLGIELEVENKLDKIKNNSMAQLIDSSHLYFKTDGSLSNGFEIVTHPLSFNWIQANSNKFKSMLTELKSSGFNSYDSNTCGMHIHISKKSFGTWQLYRFMKFFAENKDFIVSISQRKIDQLKKWANIEDNGNEELIYKAKKKDGNSSRYCAINLQNHSTIEIRIFRGTLNYCSFMKNIEFVNALFCYTNESSECTIPGFKEFVNSTSTYSNLKKFIKLKNL